ncbi:phage tail family protein [Enterococcus avium]|uniref:phage tail domain-containing protein n=1 Tax=Enterococcus avium TaxID=33945 RepID=UPI0025B15CE2|nr:phage tail domain-containing protein [Enterococcus avium]MDN2639321.1 phage tail family protein [Enterococcus avium]
MDLYIEKDGLKTRMSSLGVLVQDIQVSNAAVESNRKRINGKNGNLFMGATHTEKKISVVGKYYVSDELQDELMKDRLNGIFADTEPYFITRMYSTGTIYEFERPGQKLGFDLLKPDKQRKYHYRYKVLLDGEIDYSFQGFSDAGLLYEISFTLVTADVPFGMTEPDTIELSGEGGFIEYKGTAPCSQLEWPWAVQVIANSSPGTKFTVTIGDRTLSYEGKKSIVSGDIFLLEGSSFTLNGLNINDQTNFEYFVLEPSERGFISYSTSMNSASIQLLNKVDFYR